MFTKTPPLVPILSQINPVHAALYVLNYTVVVGRMVRGEGAWFVCVSISCTGDGGQLGSSFLWSGRGGWGGQDKCRKS